MSNASPLELVQEEHGSKAQLAKKVFEVLEHPDDEDEAQALEYRVQTMSNRKLLRLWNAHQVLSDKFGSRDELVDAILSARFPGGNEDYEAKIKGFTVPKLLDVARQANLVSAAELRWRK